MPDDPEHPEFVTQPPKPAKPTQVLVEVQRPTSWRQRARTLSLIGIVAVCLIAATGGALILLRNYKITIAVESRHSRTTQKLPTANNVAPSVSAGGQFRPTPASTPTPRVSATSDTPTITPAINIMAQANTAYQLGLHERDRQQLQAALDLLAEAEASDPIVATKVARLQSQVYYALDTLNGTVYLDAQNTMRWTLATTDGSPLINPVDLTISNEGIYIIDSGTLYRSGLSALAPGGGNLALTAILTPAMQIGGYPVKEIVAVEATNTDDAIFVLDKSNDVYRYSISSGEWLLEQPQASEYSAPDPLYLNISTYMNRLYLLDPARNQIWRHPPNESGIGYLPGTLPWLLKPGEPDVSAGIDLAIDRNIYVLWRDGTIVTHAPNEIARFTLTAADGHSHVQGLEELPMQPVAIVANVEGMPLYVADPGRRRVVAFDRHDGRLLWQLVAPDNLNFAVLHGIAERESRLYMLAGANLYSYDVSASITDTMSLEGYLPVLQPPPQPDPDTMHPGDLAPNDPRLPSLLATYNFTMPLKGALLPDRSAIYPGSRRAYRYGIHQGVDLYGKDIGVEVKIGTPVEAAGNGTIIRADVDYQEMDMDQVNFLLSVANARHFTPAETLDRLGGRQIWIDHGNGVITKYLHLSGIVEGITVTQRVYAGQPIGYVGLSGTPDGIAGNMQFPHLHFEIRVGSDHQYYLGAMANNRGDAPCVQTHLQGTSAAGVSGLPGKQ